MNKCRINIAIVESSLIICEGLSNILMQSGNHYNFYRFDTLEEVIAGIQRYKIDVVILNPVIAQSDVKDFLQKKNAVPAVVWVGIVYSFYSREVLNMLDATIEITDLSETITHVIARLTSSKCHCLNCKGTEQLTTREIDVLKQVALGLSNKEIAETLNISVHTVVSHRKNIIQKTGIKSQAGLTIYAISNKIIQLEDYSG